MAKPKRRREVGRETKAAVEADLQRLKGYSTSETARDDKRGAASPLGHGQGEAERKGKRK